MNRRLTWVDDRWHVDGRGIHAGDAMELLTPRGGYKLVRIESADCGRRLFAYASIGGLDFVYTVDTQSDVFRWPE